MSKIANAMATISNLNDELSKQFLIIANAMQSGSVFEVPVIPNVQAVSIAPVTVGDTVLPTVTVNAAVGQELDDEGYPWDERIHSGGKSKVKSKLVKGGEAFYIIYLMDDRNRNKKFALVESTMGEEPMVLPTDVFWGLTMKWVPHLRYMQIFQHIPETLADRAKHFFIRAHNNTNHRYDGKPYSFHLTMVVNKFHKFKHLIDESDHDRVEAELWGHDGIEDVRLTYNDVKEAFNEDIAEGCYSMTNDKGRNRKARAGKSYYDGLAADEYGEFKKLCDRLANMENSLTKGHSMGKQYRKEFESFENSLRTHGDTYKEMWDELKELING